MAVENRARKNLGDHLGHTRDNKEITAQREKNYPCRLAIWAWQ
jgi:hypothetical protein